MQSPGARSSPRVLQAVSENATQRIWYFFIVAGLVAAWCVLDSWNHDMSSHLFQMSGERGMPLTHSFKYTLTLAFLQFAFVGIVSCAMFATMVSSKGESVTESLQQLRPTIFDARWPALVTTHIFGSLLLQSLMMPAYMMSLSLFAATRAFEIPVAAGVRKRIFGEHSSAPSVVTTTLMFAAAWLLFFSYTQIAECLCVWSGFGVELSGFALYFVYAFLLTIPATNVVLQESVLVHLQVHPILMSGIQNLAAAVLFLPILLGAHWFGYEDVAHAAAMIAGHREIYMTVLWLCIQTLALSLVTIGMIMTTDSFWAIAARSARVVFWFSRQLVVFYITSDTLMSVARPHASLWSLVMIFGIGLGIVAYSTDRRQQTPEHAEHKTLRSTEDRAFDSARGLGMGKYV